jgi:site-specific DNA recombinase
MRTFYGYIRVSTLKQGERGVSLQEQKAAIERYSQRYGLSILSWFEERETAAKRGRPVFTQMLKGLRSRKVNGVILHKIDRGARNLKDWADLGELIDQGLEIHFANESLDLNSRGGRLSADIQAVVAADYIRNLRDEVRKGFYGRLKQGLYPLPAPLGYTNKGGGKPKEPDAIVAPLIKKAFELYASGKYSLDHLAAELYRRGLRTREGGQITRSMLDYLLRNPFYMGLIRIRRSGEYFSGIHQPLVTKSLFDRVQETLNGKATRGVQQHDYLFRQMFRCKHCRHSLSGERQKGHIYYRCHTNQCLTTCVREEVIEGQIVERLREVQLSEKEANLLADEIRLIAERKDTERYSLGKTLTLRLNQAHARLDRLTDVFMDEAIDKQMFERRKTALLMEQKQIEEELSAITEEEQSITERLYDFLELLKGAYSLYELGSLEQKRSLLKNTTSNRLVNGKQVEFSFRFPFERVANWVKNADGAPLRDRLRTLECLLPWIREGFTHDQKEP